MGKVDYDGGILSGFKLQYEEIQKPKRKRKPRKALVDNSSNNRPSVLRIHGRHGTKLRKNTQFLIDVYWGIMDKM